MSPEVISGDIQYTERKVFIRSAVTRGLKRNPPLTSPTLPSDTLTPRGVVFKRASFLVIFDGYCPSLKERSPPPRSVGEMIISTKPPTVKWYYSITLKPHFFLCLLRIWKTSALSPSEKPPLLPHSRGKFSNKTLKFHPVISITFPWNKTFQSSPATFYIIHCVRAVSFRLRPPPDIILKMIIKRSTSPLRI